MKSSYWFGLFGLLLLAVVVYFTFAPESILVETHTVKKSDFRETIKIDGRLRSKVKKTVVAFADGDILEVSLRAGDEVKAGELITTNIWDSRTPIKSPINGTVSYVHRQSAGPIRRGDPIVDIVDTDNIEVVTEMLTSDATRIPIQGKLQINGWGGEVPLTATVKHISRSGFTKTSALGVEEERTEIRSDLNDPPTEIIQRLGDNYHVDVEYLIAEHLEVLTVPIGALFKSGESWAVYKVLDGRAQLTNIEVGKKNDQDIIVLGGLNANEEVILFPGDHIKNQIRVRTK